jgi:adenylate cyclase
MVGPFAQGMAADQKPTPLGLMYGVEIHANALNTILMNKFLITAPWWLDLAILAGLVLLTAFMFSRLSTIWAFLRLPFPRHRPLLTTSIIFDQKAFIIGFADPAIGVILTLITVVVYRAMTEEKDKRHIKDMFGKYVSPSVVAE